MSKSSPVTPGLKERIKLKYINSRRSLLRTILKGAGIEYIANHWIYINDLDADSIVIDLGANIGSFSKEITRLYDNKCYAIEPNTELYNQLNHKNITSLNYAITVENGPVNFYVNENPEASSIIKSFDTEWENSNLVVIEGVAFRSLLERLQLTGKTIDILKVDIEGAELELFESLGAEDLKHIKQISVEFHDWVNRDLHTRTVQVINKLISLGFEAYTDTPSDNWTVEMFFFNKNQIKLNSKQRFYLNFFKKLTVVEKITLQGVYSIFSRHGK